MLSYGDNSGECDQGIIITGTRQCKNALKHYFQDSQKDMYHILLLRINV